MKSGVFLERDGVLNICEARSGREVSPTCLEEFKVNLAAKPLIEALKAAGFVVIVATNQPLVSQGRLSRNELDMMHAVLRRKLPVDDILVCPHDDPTHPCCKPNPGLFIEAAFKWSLDLDHSFVISNKREDAKAAQVAGCTSLMIESPWIGDDHHDFVVADLEAAVKKILQLHGGLQRRAAVG